MINKTLNFLTINDVYNVNKNYRGQGGLAEMKTMINKYKKKYPNSIFTLNGDFLSGNNLPDHGKPMIDVLNHMGLDFVALGNHEIEIGTELDKRVEESNFGWLCANAINEFTKEIYQGFKDYEIRIVDGVKIGFFGLITKHIYHFVKKREGLDFTDPIATTKIIMEKLMREKVDVIVCLSHMDWDEDKELARRFPSINLILGGHNHNAATYVQGETLIMKAGTNAEFLGYIKLDLEINIVGHNGSSIKNITTIPTYKLIPNKGFEPDPVVLEVVQKYVEKVDEKFLEPIAILKSNLDSRSNFVRSVETSMSNMLADAVKEHFGEIVDLVIVSAGSIRGDRLYSYGDKLTMHDLQNEFPFKNPLKLVQLTGKNIKALFEEGLSKAELVLGSFPVVSKGVEILFDFSKSGGSRVIRSTLYGKEFIDEKLYFVVTTSYLSNGGDGYTSFKQSVECPHENNMCSMLDATLSYVKKHSHNLKAQVEGRIVAV